MCGNDEDGGGGECVCVSAHMALDAFLVSVMKIEPLNSSSGRRLLKQTKTEAPQSVSLSHLSSSGRQLHLSQHLSVCVFSEVPLSTCIFHEGGVLR